MSTWTGVWLLLVVVYVGLVLHAILDDSPTSTCVAWRQETRFVPSESVAGMAVPVTESVCWEWKHR